MDLAVPGLAFTEATAPPADADARSATAARDAADADAAFAAATHAAACSSAEPDPDARADAVARPRKIAAKPPEPSAGPETSADTSPARPAVLAPAAVSVALIPTFHETQPMAKLESNTVALAISAFAAIVSVTCAVSRPESVALACAKPVAAAVALDAD